MREEEVLYLFPESMRGRWRLAARHAMGLQEIRLRVNVAPVVRIDRREWFLSADGSLEVREPSGAACTAKELEAVLAHLCQYSVYAFADEIRQGFLTVQGGHRVGLAGQVILEENSRVRNIKYIRYINIRIAHEIKGVSAPVLPYLYDSAGQVRSTLLISPPGCGKTTMLRDMIRCISDGTEYGAGMNVGVVDERSEIAGCYMGVAQNDVGIRTDVMDGCPKREGMMMMMRAMTPQVLAVDELGGQEDIQALRMAVGCGCKLLATMHGGSLAEVKRKKYMRYVLEEGVFERFVLLDRAKGVCRIAKICDAEGKNV